MGLNMDLKNMPYTEQLQFYVNHMHPLINKNALFADGTVYYRSFIKNDSGYTAVLRFRTGINNVEFVYVVLDGREIAMKKFMKDPLFDYYEAVIPCGKGGQEYYFKAVSGRMTVYYNKRGAMDEVQSYYSFRLVPDFHTRTGLKALYFIKFLWIVFVMAILPMMWWIMSTFISTSGWPR